MDLFITYIRWLCIHYGEESPRLRLLIDFKVCHERERKNECTYSVGKLHVYRKVIAKMSVYEFFDRLAVYQQLRKRATAIRIRQALTVHIS